MSAAPATPSPEEAGQPGTGAPPADLSLAEAAAELGVHYMTAYRYVRTGTLRATQRAGQWRVTPEAIEDLRRAQRTDPPRPGRPSKRTGASARPAPASPKQVAHLAERLAAGDQAGTWAMLQRAIDRGRPVPDVYRTLLAPALGHIGDEWAEGRMTIGDEHRASVVAMRLIGRLGTSVSWRGPGRGVVVLAGAPHDLHAMPTAIVADLLRAEGLRVTDLGAATPAADIAAAAADQDRLLAVGICATTPPDAAEAAELAAAVRAVREQTSCPVLVGGAAFRFADGSADGHVGADHVSTDVEDAIAWFTQQAGRHRTPPGGPTP